MPLVSLSDLLGPGGSKIGTPELQLPDSVVTHDSIDKMHFANYADDSPRFRRVAIEDAPQIPVDVKEPDPIDMTKATPEEFLAYQQAAKAAKEAKDNAPPYHAWDKLTRDVFYSYHTQSRPEIIEPVDPRVELHKRILPKMTATDEHAQARNVTQGDPTMAGVATMAAVNALRELLGDELMDQAKESQSYAQQEQRVRDLMDQRTQKQDEAESHGETGQPVPGEISQAIQQLTEDIQQAQQAAADIAANVTPMTASAIAAIEKAAKAGQQAAEQAANLPAFGSGFGQGEPVYESPEQALSIAEMWANNPSLRAMAELFGRMDRDIRFKRSRRVVGGQDEIVDVEFGDNLNRVLPDELALFADEDFEMDFLQRYGDAELLQFSTVGEENAGRGPIVVVVDGSYSMKGDRNIWARAIAMCLLHIARLEKRDFACVEFADADEVQTWVFEGKKALAAQEIVNMASHFFGGGTAPYQGIVGAAKLMDDAAPFKKADIVLIGDGDAGFGDADKRLRDRLVEKGVRLFGIAIGPGRRFRYLEGYCENTVHVSDFELTDPSQATAELATHVT